MAMIIAEAGTGHYATDPSNRLDKAVDLVHAAASCGANYVKFQMFVPGEELFCPMDGDEARWDRWNNTVLQLDQWHAIDIACDSCGIGFMASAFQYGAVDMLKELEPNYYKVASRAAKTYPYELARGPFIVSMGIGPKVKFHVPQVFHLRTKFLTCKGQYPTPLNESRWYEGDDGLSDHSGTVWPAIDTLARGAEIVEVHMCLKDDFENPDFDSSLFPEGIEMICEARDAFAQMRQD